MLKKQRTVLHSPLLKGIRQSLAFFFGRVCTRPAQIDNSLQDIKPEWRALSGSKRRNENTNQLEENIALVVGLGRGYTFIGPNHRDTEGLIDARK